MKKGIKGSVSLMCLDAFRATAEYESYARAGEELGVSSTTVMRRVSALELWLHRILIWSPELFLTEDGATFIPTAVRILLLMDKGNLRDELSKTRVHPDGLITIGGELYSPPEAPEIGRLMLQSRADLNSVKTRPTRVSGNDPLIAEFLADQMKRAGE